MSRRKDVVERYIDGFRRSDHAQILSCLTDDVVWEIHGQIRLEGKDAFDAEIEHEEFESPALRIDRLIEADDAVVAMGGGSVARKGGGEATEFVFCEVFAVRGETVNRLDTYHVNLG